MEYPHIRSIVDRATSTGLLYPSIEMLDNFSKSVEDSNRLIESEEWQSLWKEATGEWVSIWSHRQVTIKLINLVIQHVCHDLNDLILYRFSDGGVLLFGMAEARTFTGDQSVWRIAYIDPEQNHHATEYHLHLGHSFLNALDMRFCNPKEITRWGVKDPSVLNTPDPEEWRQHG